MAFKVHPTSISLSRVGDIINLLVYLEDPATSAISLSASSSDESVVLVSPDSQIIDVGDQDANFDVSIVGEGTASLSFTDGTDVVDVPVDISHIPVQLEYLPPDPVKAVLTDVLQVEVEISLPDVDTLIQDHQLSRIHFQVSDDDGVSFRDLTSEFGSPAVVETSTDPDWNLDGAHLHLVSDSIDYSVVFEGRDPWTPQRVAEWIYNHTGLDASVSGDVVWLSTSSVGQQHYIEVVEGSAVDILGLQVEKVYGTDVCPSLVSGIIDYTFVDTSEPAVGLLYRYRLETDGGDYSMWSDTLLSETQALVADDELCSMSVEIIDEDGDPIVGRKVVVSNPWIYVTVSGLTYAVAGSRWVLTTNSKGRAEVKLLRGMVVDVSISGTPLSRRIKVPDQDSADFFDPDIRTDADRWSVVVDNTPSGLRF